MDDMGKRTQEWQDSNPLIVWRKTQNLTSQQVADKLGLTARRLLELETGSRPKDEEWKLITPRTGITPEQLVAWERAKPHVGVKPPPN